MKSILKSLLNKFLRIFYIFPINKNKIVFRSSQGEKYNCNPKYITEYLLEHNPDKFRIVWIFNNPSDYQYLKKKNITICKSGSISSLFHLSTAKFIIDNHGIQSYLPVRDSQITINTWHGGGSYKRGRKHRTESQKQYTKEMEKKTKYYISSCEKFSKNNLSHIPEKSILPFGMARNDLFFYDTSEIKERVKMHYNIPDEYGLIIFAPTFRRMDTDTIYNIDYSMVMEACERRFNKTFVFAYRLHEFVENNNSNLKENNNLLNINDYEDMQELIAACDIIITDYSSLIWDAALAKKPCFIYAADLQDYIDDRDFYTPIEQWPFPLAQNNDELKLNILNFNKEKYNLSLEKHLKDLGSYENGKAAEKLYYFLINH